MMLEKKSILGILALTVIALLVYFFSNPTAKKKTSNIASVYEDKIDKIVIENGKGTLTLIKKTAKGDWRLKENDFPIAPRRLASFLQHFNFAKIKSLVARKPVNHFKYWVADAKNKARKEENGQRVKIFQNDDVVLDIILGRIDYSPERVRFIRFTEDNEVYSSSVGSLPDLELDKEYWFNKSLYNFNVEKIISFEFAKGNQKDTFVVKGKKFVSQKSPKKKIAQKNINSYLNQLASLETLPIIKKTTPKESISEENLTEFTVVKLELADKTILSIHQLQNKNNFYVGYQLQNTSPRWQLAQEIAKQWHFQLLEREAAVLEKANLKKFYQ